MARRTKTVYAGAVLVALLAFAISQLFLLKPPAVGASYSDEASLEQLHPYLHYLHSFSDRRRANIYFENTQPIFYGAQVNYVNVGRGNLTFARRDLVTTGRMPVVIARVHDSAGAGSIEFGPGWRLSAAERIEVGEGTAKLFTESGAALNFVASGSDFLPAVDAPSDYPKLTRASETLITTTLRTEFRKEFSLIGGAYRLTRVSDQNGNQVQLSYTGNLLSRIQNANHYVDLTRNAQGRVTLVRDDLGRSVGYGYDDKGMLAQVTDLGGNVWTYQYTGQNQLHRAVDPAGRENFKAWYMSDGRVNAIDLPSGRISYVYDDSARSTTVTDRKTLVSQYFQNGEGVTTRVINALGEETSIGLDGEHNVIELRRNGVLAEQMQYGPDHRLAVRHSFGASGETVAQYQYAPVSGQVARISYNNGQVREFSYDGQGNVTRVSDASGVQQFGYSAAGDLQSFANPTSTLQLGYSSDGLINQVTDSGGTATLQYAGGRLSQLSFADGAWARMEYTALGLRMKLEYSNGSSIGYSYDPAGNLTGTAVVKADGSRDGETLTVDDSYQVTRQLLANGTEVLFGYDKNGNLTDVSAGSSVTRFEYDALNRLTAVVTDAGQRLEYSYEPGERSIVDEYDSASLSGSERQDSGLTFASQWEVFANRGEASQFGAVRFSGRLEGFLPSGIEGKEVVTPQSRILAALSNLRLTDDEAVPLRSRLGKFNRPVNLFFLPGEYATINCCIECPLSRGFVENCDPCGPDPTPDPLPPPPPTISGPNTVWYFGGLTPSGYATQITLTASGGDGTYGWIVSAGADKITFSSSGNTATVTSNGSTFSGAPSDIQIKVSSAGQTTSGFGITSRTPRKLAPGGVTHSCDATYAYADRIHYTIQDQLSTNLPAAVDLSENWTTAVVNDYSGTNWRRGSPGGLTGGPSFDDFIQGEVSTMTPTPLCSGNATAVQHWGQEWRIGSVTPGTGVRVQTDTLQKYRDHAAHTAVTSPAP